MKLSKEQFEELFSQLNQATLKMAEFILESKKFSKEFEIDINKCQQLKDYPFELLNEKSLEEIIVNNEYPLKENAIVDLLPFFNKKTLLILLKRLKRVSGMTIIASIPFLSESEFIPLVLENIKNIPNEDINTILDFTIDSLNIFKVLSELENIQLINPKHLILLEQQQLDLLKK